jgi:RNA polymerase sigma-70 factor (ECF subfamily)
MSQLNDISLVAQVVVFRNTRAFDRLVGKYQSSVRRFFLHLTCGDSELSDDLAQDTFIKAYTNLASFKNLSSFSTWLYRIAYNVFYDYLRTRKETDSLETLRVDAQYSTQQNDIGRHMDIYRALNMLKETERKWEEGLVSVFQLMEARNRLLVAKAEKIRVRLQYELTSRLTMYYRTGSFINH